jgi:hypothetical protein
MDNLKRLYNYLKKSGNKKILFLTTSNRWSGDKELPKSSIIAEELMKKLGNERCQIINVSKLKIFPCEGNVSTKRGNTCSLIERLTWLENRHTTLGESNLLKNKEAGIVAVGHNWNGKEAVALEKEVLKYFGFKVPTQLSFNWQFLNNAKDESKRGYLEEFGEFLKEFDFVETLKESVIRFTEWIKDIKK